MFTVASQEGDGSPWPIFERILASHNELAELKAALEMGITIAFLFREGGMRLGGRNVIGACCTVSPGSGPLQGLLLQLLTDTVGYDPTFIVVLDADWWGDASALEREALVFHEVLHIEHAKDEFGTPRFNRQTGAPIMGTRSHDLEEFNAVVRRYGVWKADIEEFLKASREFAGSGVSGDVF